ncbi:MAG TPA: glucose 1-dehydrogenase [Rhodanobacteraceae bacterium]|nr:glucose 1-dehydrogenase [Rhodanobacteraceae bacterium]
MSATADTAGAAEVKSTSDPAVAPQRLRGQAALVTGANSGIGEAIARELAAEGAAVVVNYVVDPAAAEAVVKDIRAAGGQAMAIKADVSREDDVRGMFAEAVKALGTLDIVVSNAGIQRDAALVDMTLAQWDQVLGVNLTGGFLCAREAAREFLRRGPRPEVSRATGKIIFTSSVHQVIAWAGHANYASTKGGIMMFMQSIAQELAPQKIRVNNICPGAIRTPINHDAWATPDAEKALLTLIPYGRVGESADIAKATAWLASDEADYICGASLFVDGGMTLYPGFATGG